MEHASITAYKHSEKLPLSTVVAEMEKDASLIAQALLILGVEDVGSTYSPATAISGLINHWLVNRDLLCYIRNEPVKDVAALTVLPVEGDYGKGVAELENWIAISKEELATLLKKRDLPLPTFLRSIFEDEMNEQGTRKEEVVTGIPKNQVASAFEGLLFDFDHWKRNLATPPAWLKLCRVAKGNKKTSATWNPVLIAIALYDKRIALAKLNAVFFNSLKDWADEWREESAKF